MSLTDERRKAMYAGKFKKAQKKSFGSVKYWHDKIAPNSSPQKKLDDSIMIRKSILDQANITKEEQTLMNKAKYHAKKRIDVSLHGVKMYNSVRPKRNGRLGNEKSVYNHHWQNERQAIIDHAKLQDRKIRDDF